MAQNDVSLSEAELATHLAQHLELLGEGYASQYPQCSAFCVRARQSMLESLRRLNAVPRSDPLWTNTNLRPSVHKLSDYCRRLLGENPREGSALWTLAALRVSAGEEGFGGEHWRALAALGESDVGWPICAALLQGGPAGTSDAALAELLRDMRAIEAARPLLREFADSASPHVAAWAARVLAKL